MRGDAQYPYTELPDARFSVTSTRRGWWLVIDANTDAIIETHSTEDDAQTAADQLNRSNG